MILLDESVTESYDEMLEFMAWLKDRDCEVKVNGRWNKARALLVLVHAMKKAAPIVKKAELARDW